MFKVGDKVVCIERVIREIYNKVYTIVSIDHDGFIFTQEAGGFKPEWLVLEQIYNSPLYNALKEE